MKYSNTSGRYALLDELRGLDLVSMMLYHGCWDLVNLFGIQADWYYSLPGHLWQQSICWVFILLSGFCQLSEALRLTPFTATRFMMQRWQVRLRGI